MIIFIKLYRGTSLNDVRRFLAIFDIPIFHVRRFLPYNIRYLGAFLDPPTYPKIIYGRSLASKYFIYLAHSILNIGIY